ncbi:hypothetical protein ACPEIC_10355 [Stenotrophomonas sp. NPDC087984]
MDQQMRPDLLTDTIRGLAAQYDAGAALMGLDLGGFMFTTSSTVSTVDQMIHGIWN